RGAIFVEMCAQQGAHESDVGGGNEVFDMLVLQHQRAVFVWRKKFGRAVRAGVFAGAVVAGDTAHLVLRSDGDDEFDGRPVGRIGGSEQGQTAGEAETHDANRTTFVVGVLGGHPFGRVSNGADRVG